MAAKIIDVRHTLVVFLQQEMTSCMQLLCVQVLETAQLAVYEVDGKRLKKPALCPGNSIDNKMV
jgi:hypothetical protein